MLKRLISALFGVRSSDTESRKPKEPKDASFSMDISVKSNEFCVRIVHAGGKEDLYHNPILVSQLIKKYPGMCIAWPEVFKNPHESVLSASELLLPGRKYYLVPGTTLKKLKKKHSAKKTAQTVAPDESEESVCSSKDYHVSRRLVKRHVRGSRQHLRPISRSKSCRGSEWEPSLTSIQELSP